MDALVYVLHRNECHLTPTNFKCAISIDQNYCMKMVIWDHFCIIKWDVSCCCEFILMLILGNITLSQTVPATIAALVQLMAFIRGLNQF